MKLLLHKLYIYSQRADIMIAKAYSKRDNSNILEENEFSITKFTYCEAITLASLSLVV